MKKCELKKKKKNPCREPYTMLLWLLLKKFTLYILFILFSWIFFSDLYI